MTLEEAEDQAEVAEWDAEVNYVAQATDRLLELLAWTLRQAASPSSLKDTANWPEVWVMDWPETRKVALADPLVFDLARFQISHDLKFEPARDLTIFREFATLELAAFLLETERPSGKGLPAGRVAVKILLRDIHRALEEMPWLWKIRTPHGPNKGIEGFPAINAIASAIADRLTLHHLLVDHANSILTSDAIRAILKSQRKKP